MNLIVDIGNSRIKAAVFLSDKMLYSEIIERNDFVAAIQQIQSKFPKIVDVLISYVGKMESNWETFIQENFKLLKFSSTTPLPFKNRYKTPNTLGSDRIGLVAAAQHKFPNKNVLVIDAGTCITYDFLNQDGEFIGGAISPGLQMRLKALHTFTETLPLLKPEEQTEFIGKDTFENIQIGTLTATSLEIDSFIALYTENFKNLTVILTGGDHLLLSNHIKNSIFASSNFLLEGLNSILEFNKTQ